MLNRLHSKSLYYTCYNATEQYNSLVIYVPNLLDINYTNSIRDYGFAKS